MSQHSNSIRHQDDDRLVDALLQGTSRTFALAIPLLTSERRRQTGVAYLLFRVADSIEDAPEADVSTRIWLLQQLRAVLATRFDTGIHPSCMGDLGRLGELWPAECATSELLRQLPRLLMILDKLPPSARNVICRSAIQTIEGMTRILDTCRASGMQIQMETVSDLQSYCYVVAGIVGEMLTDLFVLHQPTTCIAASELRSLSVGFGEFLQLTNILKDSEQDARDGRVFIPSGTSRETVVELAFHAGVAANRYICLLEKHDFPDDITAFCRFICLLAEGTLNRVRIAASGSKLTREEVLQMLNAVRPSSQVIPV